jgi:hypothetical protein
MKIEKTSKVWPPDFDEYGEYNEEDRKEIDKVRLSPFYRIDGRWTWCNDDGWAGHLGSPDGGPFCSFCGTEMV